MASGVAGASSGTCDPGATEWIASAMAAKTEIASIRGGSPTAFERQIVSSRFSFSKKSANLLTEWVAKLAPAGERLQTYVLLKRLNRHIQQTLAYQVREEPGV
jgi:hypothetical protein